MRILVLDVGGSHVKCFGSDRKRQYASRTTLRLWERLADAGGQ
jgi:hypothetical protein